MPNGPWPPLPTINRICCGRGCKGSGPPGGDVREAMTGLPISHSRAMSLKGEVRLREIEPGMLRRVCPKSDRP